MNLINKRWALLDQSVAAITVTFLNCLQLLEMKRATARSTPPQSGARRLGMNLEQRQQVLEPLRVARFSGTVIRSGERFALRDADGCLYPFDSVGRAWQFEGEDVTVTANLDIATQMLHILAIESLAA